MSQGSQDSQTTTILDGNFDVLYEVMSQLENVKTFTLFTLMFNSSKSKEYVDTFLKYISPLFKEQQQQQQQTIREFVKTQLATKFRASIVASDDDNNNNNKTDEAIDILKIATRLNVVLAYTKCLSMTEDSYIRNWLNTNKTKELQFFSNTKGRKVYDVAFLTPYTSSSENDSDVALASLTDKELYNMYLAGFFGTLMYGFLRDSIVGRKKMLNITLPSWKEYIDMLQESNAFYTQNFTPLEGPTHIKAVPVLTWENAAYLYMWKAGFFENNSDNILSKLPLSTLKMCKEKIEFLFSECEKCQQQQQQQQQQKEQYYYLVKTYKFPTYERVTFVTYSRLLAIVFKYLCRDDAQIRCIYYDAIIQFSITKLVNELDSRLLNEPKRNIGQLRFTVGVAKYEYDEFEDGTDTDDETYDTYGDTSRPVTREKKETYLLKPLFDIHFACLKANILDQCEKLLDINNNSVTYTTVKYNNILQKPTPNVPVTFTIKMRSTFLRDVPTDKLYSTQMMDSMNELFS